MKTNKSYPRRLVSFIGNQQHQRWFTPAKGLLALTLVFTVLALAPACPAYACSCIQPPPPKESLAQAAAVFQGEVVEVGALEPVNGMVNTADMIQVTFNVNQVWKGEIAEVTTLTTAGSSASCGFEFQPGQSYLVYADLVEGQLNASLCSRTAPVDLAGEDLQALGEGTAPLPGEATPTPYPPPEVTPEPSGLSRLQWIGVAGAGAVVLGAGLLLAVWLIKPRK